MSIAALLFQALRSSVLCLVALVASFGSLRASDKAEGNAEEDWMQFYYQKPAPTRLEAEFTQYSRLGYLHKDGSVPPIAAFLGQLCVQNENLLPQWEAFFLKLPKEDRSLFVVALWLAHSDAAQKKLEELATRNDEMGQRAKAVVGKPPARDLRKITAQAPEELDMCWGAFFATGDQGYALTVLRYAAKIPKPGAIDLTHESAKWSVLALTRTHPRIREIRDEFLRTASEEEKKQLLESASPSAPQNAAPQEKK